MVPTIVVTLYIAQILFLLPSPPSQERSCARPKIGRVDLWQGIGWFIEGRIGRVLMADYMGVASGP